MDTPLATARITSKGQLTVPKIVRDRLGLRPGDELEFAQQANQLVVRKVVSDSPFEAYVGYLTDKRGEDPDEIVRELRGRE